MSIYGVLSFISLILFVQGIIFAFYHVGPSRERTAFVAVMAAVIIFVLFTFIPYFSDNVDHVYFFDRIASVGWTTFPVLIVWLVYVLLNVKSKVFKFLIAFFLTPLSLIALFRYNYNPESIKTYYYHDGAWYFSVNIEGLWFYLFVVYLFSCVAVSLAIIFRDWQNAKSSRQRKQLKSIIIGLIAFFFFSAGTNLALPFFGYPLIPPMAHVNIIFLGIGFFVAVVIYSPPSFDSKVLWQFISKHLPDFVFYFDQRGTLFAVNRYCAEQLKFNSYEILRIQYDKLFGDAFLIQRLFTELQEKGKPVDVFMELLSRNGDSIPVHFVALRITDGFGIFSGMVLIGFDQRLTVQLKSEIAERIRNERILKRSRMNLETIVEKRTMQLQLANDNLHLEILEKTRAEEQIALDLKEKMGLLREVHHRVKNNFQIIVSLARMLEFHADMNENYRNRLRRFSERIRLIANIHEYFYSTQKLSKINFSEFLKKSTAELNANLSSGKKIFFRLNVGEELLDLDHALYCGIVFHELMTNSIRHAFKPDQPSDNANPSVILVDFFQRGQNFNLILSDNGARIPDFSKHSTDETAGFNLVKLLVDRHLSGKLTIDAASGTTIRLSFPKLKEQTVI